MALFTAPPPHRLYASAKQGRFDRASSTAWRDVAVHCFLRLELPAAVDLRPKMPNVWVHAFL